MHAPRLLASLFALLLLLEGSAIVSAQPIETPTLFVDYDSFDWTAAGGAEAYDVVRGDLVALRQSGGDFRAATRACLADDFIPNQLFYAGGVPKPGEAFYFLVRAVTATEAGTYDSGGPGQAGTRDPEIDAAAAGCYSPVAIREPIVIGSDAEFTTANGVVGGAGTPADPYVLAGWDIACATMQGTAGVLISDTTRPFVIRNVLVAGCQDGILLSNTRNGSVVRSQIYLNVNGLRLAAGGNAEIEGNYFDANSGSTIKAVGATDLSMTWNDVYGGGGIHLDGVTSSTAHHNNFSGNSTHAIDENSDTNIWNDAYPEGGNYWGGYPGQDACHGPNQDDCAYSDGFGDTPNDLDVDTSDRYPRMTVAAREGDTIPPTLVITGPADGTVVTGQPISVHGTAADYPYEVESLNRVEVRRNGGPWTIATGVSPWDLSTGLTPGTNLIEARAIDDAGYISPIDAIAVTYSDVCAGRTGGAIITFSFRANSETLHVWITNDSFIDTAQQFLAAGSQTMVAVFNTLRDGRDCDSQWTWHPDPIDVAWFPAAIELCDGLPSSVEANKEYWFEIGFCPWTGEVIAVYDQR